MDMMSAAQRIKQRRKELKLSYQQLADRTGIARSTLQRYETGNIGNIPLDKLNVLAEGLETSREYILGMSEQANAEFIAENIFKVPVFDSASAGFGAYADSRVRRKGRVPLDKRQGRQHGTDDRKRRQDTCKAA